MTDHATNSDPDIAALVASRLCHDLVSPLGAIGNGVELLEMGCDFPGIAKSPELQLIAQSVAAARGRIRVFRVAFGPAGTAQRMGMGELAQLVADATGEGRLCARVDAEGDLSRNDAQMILLAVMCLETVLPWGGNLLIARGARGWRILADAPRNRPAPDLWAHLEGTATTAPVPAFAVQFPLLAAMAVANRRPLSAEIDAEGAEIAF